MIRDFYIKRNRVNQNLFLFGLDLKLSSLYFSDEGALVKGAKKLGFSFNVRTPTSVIINAVRKAL